MRYRFLFFLVVIMILVSCKKEKGVIDPPAPPPPSPPQSRSVLLKDIVTERLPSPYYHFGYDTAGKANFVSFASGFAMYDIIYDGDKISEMRNNSLVNEDRLLYSYDNEGRVNLITYVTGAGEIYIKVHLTYDEQKLIKLERERKLGSDFILNKTLRMSYYADGNLKELISHFPITPINTTESTSTQRYEEYDNKVNVDGFGLLHDEFFDHLVFLPQVQFQKNNPGKEIRNGDGDDYTIDYTYTYNDRHAPLTKTGEFTYTSGANAGRTFQTRSLFTYY